MCAYYLANNWNTRGGVNDFGFTTDKGTKYTVEMDYLWSERYEGLEVDVNFWAHNEQGIDSEMAMTNLGEQYRVMATVTDIVVSWVNKWDEYVPIGKIEISPKTEDEEHIPFGATTSKRGKMYALYIKKTLPKT